MDYEQLIEGFAAGIDTCKTKIDKLESLLDQTLSFLSLAPDIQKSHKQALIDDIKRELKIKQ